MTAVAVIALALVVRRLTGPATTDTSRGSNASLPVHIATETDAMTRSGRSLLVPVVTVCVDDQSSEATWISAFALGVGGSREVVLDHGRADVLTAEFAFELDWFEKWHEGIGQALHYSTDTGKRPALALMIRAPEWPLDDATLSKLGEIDRVCSKESIKLILLRARC